MTIGRGAVVTVGVVETLEELLCDLLDLLVFLSFAHKLIVLLSQE